MTTQQLCERRKLQTKINVLQYEYDKTMLELRQDIGRYMSMGIQPDTDISKDFNRSRDYSGPDYLH